jgi:hypothetical protein
MTLLNSQALIVDTQGLYPHDIVDKFKIFIYVSGATQVFLGLITVFGFHRNSVQVEREERYRKEFIKMN